MVSKVGEKDPKKCRIRMSGKLSNLIVCTPVGNLDGAS